MASTQWSVSPLIETTNYTVRAKTTKDLHIWLAFLGSSLTLVHQFNSKMFGFQRHPTLDQEPGTAKHVYKKYTIHWIYDHIYVYVHKQTYWYTAHICLCIQTCVCVCAANKEVHVYMCTWILSNHSKICYFYVFTSGRLNNYHLLSRSLGHWPVGKLLDPPNTQAKGLQTVAARTGSPCIPAAVVGAVIASLVRLNQMPNIPLTRLHVDMTIKKT